MGYGFTAYQVDLERLGAFVDGRVDVEPVIAAMSDLIGELDEDFADDIDDGAPSVAQALRHGGSEQMDEEFGQIYAYALQVLCGYAGTELANRGLMPIPGGMTGVQ
ncbi:hypothetical protein EDD30_0229 [Couchioplanes caeruleus]|uniref:DUF7691 domain-containing protein n=2 Tax=Couchioplanes caeruleus TaxID=56438 RepID=A0A1K0FQN7_9ACTN|nr:hypothetical protein [Couchioplanes caeruleus]OJF15141.1 hypothetical protein BG844_06040 [Couchioplanes caeruleus subsp. caeruleus]ROP27555.1 hypothetical protein EDD30_0229 [Couchioplanes caeruleus]